MLCFCLLSLGCLQAQIQPPMVRWAVPISGVCNNIYGPVLGPDGSSYVSGQFGSLGPTSLSCNSEWICFDTLIAQAGHCAKSKGWIDHFIAKYGPDGSLLWHRTMGTRGHDGWTNKSFFLDKNGSVYMAFGYNCRAINSDTLWIGSDIYIPESDSLRWGTILAKWDRDGNLLWYKRLNIWMLNPTLSPHTDSDKMFLMGTYYPLSGGWDGFDITPLRPDKNNVLLGTLDTFGNLLKIDICMAAGNNSSCSILTHAQNKLGESILLFAVRDTVIFQNHTAVCPTGCNYFYMLDPDGELVWVSPKTANLLTYYLSPPIFDDSSNLYIAHTPSQRQPYSLFGNEITEKDTHYAIKLDKKGKTIWFKTDTTSADSPDFISLNLHALHKGSAYFNMSSNSRNDKHIYGLGPFQFDYLREAGLVSVYDSDWDSLKWQRKLDYTDNPNMMNFPGVLFYGSDFDSADNMVSLGKCSKCIAYHLDSTWIMPKFWANDGFYFLASFFPDSFPPPPQPPQPPNPDPLRIFPNPADRLSDLYLYGYFEEGETRIQIYDPAGRLVLGRQFRVQQAGNQSFAYPLRQLAAGIYVVVVSQAGGSQAFKWIRTD